ncbi:hypothetical protein KC338_g3 [Hortaea werneckii]|nr:hypothetical protein KC338_g3 [Hortaea werneckii]
MLLATENHLQRFPEREGTSLGSTHFSQFSPLHQPASFESFVKGLIKYKPPPAAKQRGHIGLHITPTNWKTTLQSAWPHDQLQW